MHHRIIKTIILAAICSQMMLCARKTGAQTADSPVQIAQQDEIKIIRRRAIKLPSTPAAIDTTSQANATQAEESPQETAIAKPIASANHGGIPVKRNQDSRIPGEHSSLLMPTTLKSRQSTAGKSDAVARLVQHAPTAPSPSPVVQASGQQKSPFRAVRPRKRTLTQPASVAGSMPTVGDIPPYALQRTPDTDQPALRPLHRSASVPSDSNQPSLRAFRPDGMTTTANLTPPTQSPEIAFSGPKLQVERRLLSDGQPEVQHAMSFSDASANQATGSLSVQLSDQVTNDESEIQQTGSITRWNPRQRTSGKRPNNQQPAAQRRAVPPASQPAWQQGSIQQTPHRTSTTPRPTPSYARANSTTAVNAKSRSLKTRNAPAARQTPVQRPAASPHSRNQQAQFANDDPVLVPVEAEPIPDNVSMQGEDGLVTLIATEASLPDVLRLIASHHKLNLVLGPDIAGPVSVSIQGAELTEVLDAILGVAGFSWHRVGNLLYVTGGTAAAMHPRVQGRTIQVYPLDYVAAADVEAVATRLLSQVGNAFITESKSDDQMRTREVLIVEDTQEAHNRIASYIAQIDVAPRQVLVEAHVLQIALDDQDRHGINLRTLADVENAGITLEGTGFAQDNVNGPSLALRIDGTDMDALIELIRENTNSRTLASPKVSVVNHQEARIQIGQRLPYSVATTTQTSTIQTVEFLEVGIVLTVTPIITDDGHVLMSVTPKVSGGRITESGFPEEDTTEVSTTILMPDGGGVVIGGLIREEDVQVRSMVPGLGKVPVLGHLFKRRSNEVRRDELVVALVTHVLPDVYSQRSHELNELQSVLPMHSQVELMHPNLGGQSHNAGQMPNQMQSLGPMQSTRGQQPQKLQVIQKNSIPQPPSIMHQSRRPRSSKLR